MMRHSRIYLWIAIMLMCVPVFAQDHTGRDAEIRLRMIEEKKAMMRERFGDNLIEVEYQRMFEIRALNQLDLLPDADKVEWRTLFSKMFEPKDDRNPKLQTAASEEDSLALVAFYLNTNMSELKYYESWLGGPVDTWEGVAVKNGRVIGIDCFLNKQLAGTISPEIGNLDKLEFLMLRDNKLTGIIPPEIGQLLNLEYLDIGINQLTGTIPHEIENLKKLEFCRLYENQISGPIPSGIGSCESLLDLQLQDNLITGPIPQEIGNLTHLNHLNLDDNQLAGPIPSEIGNLMNLKSLTLSNNQLSGSIPDEIQNCTKLEYLFIEDNQLSGPLPSWLGNMNKLVKLHLNDNFLSGSIPPELGNNQQVQDVLLDNNLLSGSIPSELGSMNIVGELKLNGNNLTGEIPSTLQSLWLGSGLDIRYNALFTNDDDLRNFLNSRQHGGDWESTQTIAPTDLGAEALSNTDVQVSWTPIVYTGDTGGYRVFYSTTPGGPYTFSGMAVDKTATSYPVSGLAAETDYYFVVSTRTNPHANNQNTVDSEYSEELHFRTPTYATLTMEVDPRDHMGTTVPPQGDNDAVLNMDSDISAVPTYGRVFVRWHGDVADHFDPNTTVTMDGDKTVRAVFDFRPHTLTMAMEPEGAGTISPAPGVYDMKWLDYIYLEAAPHAGFRFVRWEGEHIEDPTSVVTTARLWGDQTITAIFDGDDLSPPHLVNCCPAPGAQAVPRNTPVRFKAVDETSGVDLATLNAWVDGTPILKGGEDQTGEWVTVTSHSPAYTVEYMPSGGFEAGSVVTVRAACSDLSAAANACDSTWTFTVGTAVIDTSTTSCASVGQDGGTVVNDSMDVTVDIPAGALGDSVEITISEVDSLPPLPDGVEGIGLDIHFGPDGLTFEDSVAIRIPYTQDDLDAAGVTDPWDLNLYYFLSTTGEWVQLVVENVDEVEQIITVKVDRFCYFTFAGSTTSVEEYRKSRMPGGFFVSSNYPNPFNPETTFEYSIPEATDVRIAVYDMQGRVVVTLQSGRQEPGAYSVTWHAEDVPSGTYFIRFEAGRFAQMRKCVLLK